jgi:hypothetical protein
MSYQVRFPGIRSGFAEIEGGWLVKSMDWRLAGGAETALIQAAAPRFDIRQLQTFFDSLIAAPLEIYDGQGRVVWRGWVEKIVCRSGRQKMTYSLEQVYNRLIVRYPQSGMESAPFARWLTTGWLENADSLARFGPKEKLLSISQADSYLAEQVLHSSFSALHAYPSFNIDMQDEETQTSFEIAAAGIWRRLDWILDHETGGKIQHLAGGKSKYEIGSSFNTSKIAQSFRVNQPNFSLAHVWLRASLIGQPQDSLQVSVHSDSGGRPGALLGQSLAPSSSLDGAWAWTRWELGSALPLAEGSTFWLAVQRSEAISAGAYYVLESDDGFGYAAGQARRWDGSNWQLLGEDLRFGLIACDSVFTLAAEMLQRQELQPLLSGIVNWQSGQDQVYRWREFERTCKERLEEWFQGPRYRSAFIDGQGILEIIPIPRQAGNEIRVSTDIARILEQTSANQVLGQAVHFDFQRSGNLPILQKISWQAGKGYSWGFFRAAE